ncbi:MAG TPA: hypothetical protein VF668_04535 [Pyrinomonadaceae bacterium]|jgi:DNA-directed RNA polymerase specialized sigma24 family protein
MSANGFGDQNDFELLRRARAGDDDAWRELLRRHERRVSLQSLRILRRDGCYDSADHFRDVTQETLTQLLVYAPRVIERRGAAAEAATTLGGLLYKMCNHEAARHLRRERRRMRREEPLDEGAAEAALPEGVIYGFPGLAERLSLARRARREAENVRVKNFPEIFKLWYGGLTLAEAAERLGLNPEASRQAFHRGLIKLRRVLKV